MALRKLTIDTKSQLDAMAKADVVVKGTEGAPEVVLEKDLGNLTIPVSKTWTNDSDWAGGIENNINHIKVANQLQLNQVETGNLALNKLTTSSDNNGYVVVDGIFDRPYWEANYPCWVKIDLGSLMKISKIKLFWESAYGARQSTDYKISVCDTEFGTYAVIVSVTGNTSHAVVHEFLPVQTRYVMFSATAGAKSYIVMQEIEIYGLKYQSLGTWTADYDAGILASWKSYTFTADEPIETNVKVRFKSANTQANLDSATWSLYYDLISANITDVGNNQWIRTEIYLESSDGSKTPILQDITLNYNVPAYKTVGALTSNSEKIDAITLGMLRWVEELLAGTDITFATRTGPIEMPDESWSAWSGELTDPIASQMASPADVYIQFRVTFTTADTTKTPRLYRG